MSTPFKIKPSKFSGKALDEASRSIMSGEDYSRKLMDLSTNPCSEVLLDIEKADRDFIMRRHFGGVPYEEVLEMVKASYPENFI